MTLAALAVLPIPDWPTLSLFLVAVLVLNLTPGPDLLFILAQTVAYGRRAGLFSAFGIATAGLVQISLTAGGLTILLAHSDAALTTLKMIGGGYLIYLALKMILAGRRGAVALQPEPVPVRRPFTHGFLINALNPQVGLFFLAFIPQFISAEKGPAWIQIIILGLILKICGLIVNSSAALIFGQLSSFLNRNTSFLRFKGYVSGAVLLAVTSVILFSPIQ